jgi:hypothetical protein
MPAFVAAGSPMSSSQAMDNPPRDRPCLSPPATFTPRYLLTLFPRDRYHRHPHGAVRLTARHNANLVCETIELVWRCRDLADRKRKWEPCIVNSNHATQRTPKGKSTRQLTCVAHAGQVRSTRCKMWQVCESLQLSDRTWQLG